MLWFDKLDFRLGRLWVSPWPWIHQTMGGKTPCLVGFRIQLVNWTISFSFQWQHLRCAWKAYSGLPQVSWVSVHASRPQGTKEVVSIHLKKWGYSIEYSMTVWCCVIHDTVYQIYTVYKIRKIGYPPPKGMIIDMLENTIQITHLRRLMT